MRIPKTGGRLVTIFSLIFIFFSTSIASPSRQSDPCLDGESEIEVDRLKLPSKYANLTAPWQRADGKYAKVIRSDGLNYQWSWVKALRVKGTFRTVEDIIGFLNKNHCLFVPVGPFVRNVLLGQKAVYVTGEVSCELSELFESCVNVFGSSSCALFPIQEGHGSQRLEIGDTGVNRSISAAHAEPMVLYEWRSVLGAPRNRWRFTIDTLAMYDDGAGELFVIDPTATGYKHLCEKKIVPVMNDWKRWAEGQEMKVMGFYDLRSDGFVAHNETFQKFVNEKIKKADNRFAQQFYCEHVLKGVANLEGSTPVCHTMYPEKEVATKIAQMRTVMINEMGLTWNSSVGKASDDLEAVFCTPHQFTVIRSQLLHKIPTKYDTQPHFITEPPKIIEEGRPMIADIAEVHARPILGMSDDVPQLPVEHPSGPRAQPNEHLEFVEAPFIEGGGSEPVAIVASHDAPDDAEDYAEASAFSDSEGVQSQATAIEASERVEKEAVNDFSHHNSIGDKLPVMKFDKVEEGGLGDVADAMEISASSASQFSSFFFTVILVFYLLF